MLQAMSVTTNFCLGEADSCFENDDCLTCLVDVAVNDSCILPGITCEEVEVRSVPGMGQQDERM